MTDDAFLWRLSAIEVAILLIAGIVGYFLPMPFAESRLVYILSSVVVFCLVLTLILAIDQRRPFFADSTEEIEAGILDDEE
jgi:Zn-dependent protease with chaperone function